MRIFRSFGFYVGCSFPIATAYLCTGHYFKFGLVAFVGLLLGVMMDPEFSDSSYSKPSKKPREEVTLEDAIWYDHISKR